MADLKDEDSKKRWQPPPRPVEYRDLHVVDLNKDTTGKIDYFALIADRKHEKRPSSSKSSTQTAAATHSANQAETTRISKGKAAIAGISKTTGPTTAQRAQPDSATPEVTKEETMFSSVGSFFEQHRSQMMMAAGVALFFSASYGVFKHYMGDKGRLPANIASGTRPDGTKTKTNKKGKQGTNAQPGLHSGDSLLGQGHGVSHGPSAPSSRPAPNHAPMNHVISNVPNPPAPAPTSNNDDLSLREPPRIYSGDDDYQQPQALQPPAQQQPAMNGNYPGNYNDPNSGTVPPPGYLQAPPGQAALPQEGQIPPSATPPMNTPAPASIPDSPQQQY